MLSGLAEEIRRAGPAWMPGLAEALNAAFWEGDAKALRPEAYGSWRWLVGDPCAERCEVTRVPLPQGRSIIVEQLPDTGLDRYDQLELRLRVNGPSDGEFELFRKALASLVVGDRLVDAVHALVRCVHLLESDGPGYDTSYSDPALPFSIFVSLPSGERQAALRLAESILHETMHLQLTLIEARCPLVKNGTEAGYSPWQRMERPIGGLVHGLYVFRVIDQWLARVQSRKVLDEEACAYVAGRRRDIAEEINVVGGLARSPALTPFGVSLVGFLLGTGSGDTGPVHEI